MEKRRENQTFEDYKKTRFLEKLIQKHKLKSRLIIASRKLLKNPLYMDKFGNIIDGQPRFILSKGFCAYKEKDGKYTRQKPKIDAELKNEEQKTLGRKINGEFVKYSKMTKNQKKKFRQTHK